VFHLQDKVEVGL